MKQATIVLAMLSFAVLGISQTPKDKRIAVKNGALDTAPASSRKKNQQYDATPPSQAIAIYNQSSPPEHNGDAKQSQDAIDVERKLAKFTGYLVGVGLLQFLILVVQAVLFFQQKNIMGQHKVSLEKLATAASDNAKAAALNARAVINAERPWFLVNIEPRKGAPGQYVVEAFNAGRTPAIIHNGDCSCDKHSVNFVPPENLNDPFTRPKQDLIVSKDSFPIRVINPESCINQADREGGGVDPQILFVYGHLRYWDTFTDRKAPAATPYDTWLGKARRGERAATNGTVFATGRLASLRGRQLMGAADEGALSGPGYSEAIATPRFS